MKSNVSATDEAIRLMQRFSIFVLFVVDSNLGQLDEKIELILWARTVGGKASYWSDSWRLTNSATFCKAAYRAAHIKPRNP